MMTVGEDVKPHRETLRPIVLQVTCPTNIRHKPKMPAKDSWASEKGHTMLELRPTCEHCNKALPPNALDARICTYECTFCAACVERVLANVCPNCGGGFVPRPIRPSTNWKGDNYLGKDPASTQVKHRPVDPAAHATFAAAIRTIPPEKR